MTIASLIEKGWVQGNSSVRYRDGSMHYCLYGAIVQVGGLGENIDIACRAKEITGERLTVWNDDPARTKEEVLAVARQLDEEFGLK